MMIVIGVVLAVLAVFAALCISFEPILLLGTLVFGVLAFVCLHTGINESDNASNAKTTALYKSLKSQHYPGVYRGDVYPGGNYFSTSEVDFVGPKCQLPLLVQAFNGEWKPFLPSSGNVQDGDQLLTPKNVKDLLEAC